MATAAPVELDVRAVTSDEAATFREKGWVKIPQLISEEAAADLLSRAKARMGEIGDASVDATHTHGRAVQQFRLYYAIDLEDELFRALRTHEQMGKNAAQLYGRDMGIRSNTTLVAPKLPNHLDGKIEGGGAGVTAYHQDFNVMAQCNSIGFWLALDEATPEMGTMRFREGSHRLGFLTPPVEDWPEANELPLSPPLTYRPGDATAHHQLMIHGGPANTTDRTRWGFIFSYFPAHAAFMGTPSAHSDGLGLEVGKPMEHANFPLVYEPSGS